MRPGRRVARGRRRAKDLPGRLDRPSAEGNIGLREALRFDNAGHTGGNPYVTIFDEELRWPIFWELLTSYRLPLDLVEGHTAGRALLSSGVRAHEVIANPRPAFLGLELRAGHSSRQAAGTSHSSASGIASPS